MIVFYDLPSILPGKAYSLNTWKVRLVLQLLSQKKKTTSNPNRFILNYKGIPHRTEWIEYPDIEPHSKSLGIKPTGKKPDGSPFYTLPAIHDPSTGTSLADSYLIAEYLEETYPNTPSIFPHGTKSLQHAFQFSSFGERLGFIRSVILASIYLKLGTQRNQEYFRRAKELAFGGQRTLEEMRAEKEALWDKFRDGLNKIDECLAKTDDKGPFVMGDTISWADFYISGYLMSFKVVWGEDSEEWKDIASWNEGRWENLLRALGNQTIN
jgi:glutathione S-transferase